MKRKMPTALKDGLKGLAIGTAIIIPGISGGTIALVLGAFKKIVNAVDNLFTKNFWKFLLVLIPFGIGAVLSVAALIIPFQYAFKYCLFTIVCLFAGLIIGSVPNITDNIKGQPHTKANIIGFIIALVFAGIIGVFSVIFKFGDSITNLFNEVPFYLYFILFGIGVIGATGLIVPGFSGSMLLLVVGFYEPILGLISTDNIGRNISLLAVFAIGVLVGFIIFSKIMNFFLTKYKNGTYHVILGFVIGSIVSIFINSNMFNYEFPLYDEIIGPFALVIGIVVSFLFVKYVRNHPELKDAEN